MGEAQETFHVAIIPDGNRRWAIQNRLPAWRGHEAGYERFRENLSGIWDFGVTHFTFWALSVDNLKKRQKKELNFLVSLLKLGITELKESSQFKKGNIRFKVIGRWKGFIPEIAEDIKFLEDATQMRTGGTFSLCLAYDGTEEDMEHKDAIRKNVPLQLPLTPEICNQYLWSGFLPDIDLCIRTAGESHLSAGFLMHKMANAYLLFPAVYWPDFSAKHLKKAIDDFRSKERRFGA